MYGLYLLFLMLLNQKAESCFKHDIHVYIENHAPERKFQMTSLGNLVDETKIGLWSVLHVTAFGQKGIFLVVYLL